MGIGSHSGFAYKENFSSQHNLMDLKLNFNQWSLLTQPVTNYYLIHMYSSIPRYGLPSCLYNADIDLRDIQRNDPSLFNYYEERKQYSPLLIVKIVN